MGACALALSRPSVMAANTALSLLWITADTLEEDEPSDSIIFSATGASVSVGSPVSPSITH